MRAALARFRESLEAQRAPPPRRLSEEERLALWRDGFVVVPGAVGEAACDAALRAINRSLGQNSSDRRPGEACPELKDDPAILGLFLRSSVKDLVRDAVGPIHRVGGAQVALRFPGDGCFNGFQVAPHWDQHWHLDGLAAPGNPYTRAGELHNFTALVGVLLSNVGEDYCGNLTVFPGSHLALQHWFQRNGFEAVRALGVQGLPRPQEVPFPRRVEMVKGRKGDAVIVNYSVAHLVAPNVSSAIRYCCYFRVHTKDHVQPFRSHRPEAMLDVWRDWRGMRGIDQLERALELSRREGAGARAQGPPAQSRADEDAELQLALEISRVEQ